MSVSKQHSKKERSLSKHCSGKCQEKVKCHHDKEVTAEKNLLNLSYLTEGAGISEHDVSATYEIVIFNRSDSKLSHLSINDSLMGLHPNVFGPTGGFGGELRPYFTNVTINSCHPTLIPNNFDQIVAGKGELLACGSYVPEHSVCSLIVRLTGRGFLLPNFPEGGEQLADSSDFQVPNVSMCLQNTAIIRGKLCKKLDCGCHVSAPIFPLYVKSGEKQVVQMSYNLTPQLA